MVSNALDYSALNPQVTIVSAPLGDNSQTTQGKMFSENKVTVSSCCPVIVFSNTQVITVSPTQVKMLSDTPGNNSLVSQGTVVSEQQVNNIIGRPYCSTLQAHR